MSVTAPAPEAEPALRPAAGTLLEIRGLSKRFPVRRGWVDTLRRPFASEYVEVVRNVSCEVGAGEFFGLLGHNGAGKTTLFKMLATLIIPDAGTARIAGYDVVRDAASIRRVLAPVIADERSLHWRLSARENLRLFATLQGLRGSAALRRADELLETVELADAGEKMVGRFSSGMKQRLLIARALLAQPRVLLLDEPTRSLDPVSARRFRSFLREEIAGRQGCTVLLATHNTEEALELCDRVGVLDHGELLAVGTAEQLAAEIGEERYRVWTRSPGHPAFGMAEIRRLCRGLAVRGRETADGWTAVDMDIPGGPQRAAEVLAFLVGDGVPVSTFERMRLSLADLIERIVSRRRLEARDA
ncbi:MAG: ABC transporter ATP-binding protein [Gemmatimonadota bacterium]|jgi:ABC-2 type transport system ATP-binding protein|nr:ABC transporter ATP-binding protein [Gemmatimonadota bacterium]